MQMETWLLLTVYRKSPAPYPMVSSQTLYDLPLTTIPRNWHIMVRYDSSRSFKVNDFHVVWKPICDLLLVINSLSRTV